MALNISREDANNVLAFYRSGEGYDGGTFTNKLLSAIASADVHNRAKLRGAYPELVEAMQAAATSPWGIDEIRKIAGGR
ncbi:hypothetical protein E3_0905 [Rhodococcus phage E3]|uniref:hypothetical protein n=1 Tax=Rhodococcus phage E3 TaxID=1007869 RepID=UPI0002C69CCB|nr:hypothetical protein M176_gp095 [Rhodococcus phage E3]AEQ21004.1 hypothetical protein E3_0905 [Rhodococcus phage E3]